VQIAAKRESYEEWGAGKKVGVMGYCSYGVLSNSLRLAKITITICPLPCSFNLVNFSLPSVSCLLYVIVFDRASTVTGEELRLDYSYILYSNE
jgi:hypothetical protein